MSKRNKTNKSRENDDHEIMWLHLKDISVNYEYWKSNACTDWNITSYDESLSRRQFTSKRSCHIYMGEDLDRLTNAFINTKIMREMSRVEKQQSNAKKGRQPPSLFSPTKSGLLHSPVPILETNVMSLPPPFSEVVGTDGTVCDTTKLFISTILKWEAINLHNQYKHGNPLSSRQRKIMSNGLSSILDLVDQSYFPLNPALRTTLKVIDDTLKQPSNIKMGLLYLYKIYGKHHSTSLMPFLQIFEHVLNLLDQESDLLQVKPTTMISETEYVAYIWPPLFRKLFHAGTNIQIKLGEFFSKNVGSRDISHVTTVGVDKPFY
ncbi:MAG: hypothetical protein EXX96DRAFT_539369 [Benjaminiella poitrasii]|nr:MAG: hypothetical protein EXX96DRAFT_539369 [Benjaminiella poitrasii]